MRIYENSGGKGQRNGMKKKRVFLSRNENAKKNLLYYSAKILFSKSERKFISITLHFPSSLHNLSCQYQSVR